MANFYGVGSSFTWLSSGSLWSSSGAAYVPMSGNPGPSDNVFARSSSFTVASGFNPVCNNFTILGGTVNLNSRVLTCNTLSATSVENSSLNFGTTGRIDVIGFNRTVVNLTVPSPATFSTSGSKNISLTYNGGIGTRSIVCTAPDLSSSEVLNISVTSGFDQINLTGKFRNIEFPGFIGILNITSNISCYGNFYLPQPIATFVSSSSFNMLATSGNSNITLNSSSVRFPINLAGASNITVNSGNSIFTDTVTINTPNKTVTIADSLSANANISYLSGNLIVNNCNVRLGGMSSNVTSGRNLSMGSGTWTLTGTNWLIGNANCTITPSTSTLILANTNSTNVTCPTLNNLLIDSPITTTFTGNCVMNNLTSNVTSNHTIRFAANSTYSFNSFDVSGFGGNVATIDTTGVGVSNLLKTAPGLVITKNVNISDSSATPTDTWYATINATDGGNNSGWIFGIPYSGNYFLAW